jgi:heme/copper-type cytochrome/quinol oxidase subunit 2
MKIKKLFKKGLYALLIAVIISLMLAVMKFTNLSQTNETQKGDSVSNDALRIETINIISEKYMFSPTLIPLKRGVRVRLTLSTYDVQHGITVPELGISLLAYPGKPAETTIIPEKVGEFTTNCSLYCGKDHDKMKLTFKVYE